MNRLDIASLFWQFLQPNRSAVATIEMIVELIDSRYNCRIGDGRPIWAFIKLYASIALYDVISHLSLPY